jgi:hypothetical protein
MVGILYGLIRCSYGVVMFRSPVAFQGWALDVVEKLVTVFFITHSSRSFHLSFAQLHIGGFCTRTDTTRSCPSCNPSRTTAAMYAGFVSSIKKTNTFTAYHSVSECCRVTHCGRSSSKREPADNRSSLRCFFHITQRTCHSQDYPSLQNASRLLRATYERTYRRRLPPLCHRIPQPHAIRAIM